jgi:Organic solvent tolerance protein OstA
MKTQRRRRRCTPPAAAGAAAALLCLAAAPALLFAQVRQSTQAKDGSNTVPVDFQADVINRKTVNQNDIITATGGVEISSRGSTLRTEKVVFNDTTDVATAPGPVRLDDAQNTLTGDKGVAYYARRDAEITGRVKIIARPAPANDNAPEGSVRREFKEPVTITCDKVVYNWRTRKAVLTGNLVVKHKDRTITGLRGLYDGRAEQVELAGDIKSVRPNGLENIAVPNDSRAIAVLREGAEEFTVYADKNAPKGKNRIQATIAVEEEEDEGTGGATPPTSGGGAAPPPTTPPPGGGGNSGGGDQ